MHLFSFTASSSSLKVDPKRTSGRLQSKPKRKYIEAESSSSDEGDDEEEEESDLDDDDEEDEEEEFDNEKSLEDAEAESKV